jgi:hypothetical protein
MSQLKTSSGDLQSLKDLAGESDKFALDWDCF